MTKFKLKDSLFILYLVVGLTLITINVEMTAINISGLILVALLALIDHFYRRNGND